MSHMLPPGGSHERERPDSPQARATTRERIIAVVVLVALAAVVIVVWRAPETLFARTVIAIVLSPLSFAAGIGMGAYGGWSKAGWFLPDLAFTLTVATASGIVSGVLVAWLQRGFEDRRDSRVNKSLISALFSREIWVEQLPTTLMLFLVVALGGYAAASVIDAMATASLPPIGPTGSGSSGGSLDAILGLPDLIMGFVIFLGAGLAFGAVVGFFAGAPAGALYGVLAHCFQWPDLVQGAAEGATSRSMYGGRDRPHYLLRILMSAIIGGIEGAFGGAIAVVLIGALRAVGVI